MHVSQYACIHVFQYSSIQVSMDPSFHLSQYPCILVSQYPFFLVSKYSSIHVSMYPCILVSKYPSIHVSWYPCILVSKYSSIHVSQYPSIHIWCPSISVSQYILRTSSCILSSFIHSVIIFLDFYFYIFIKSDCALINVKSAVLNLNNQCFRISRLKCSVDQFCCYDFLFLTWFPLHYSFFCQFFDLVTLFLCFY